MKTFEICQKSIQLLVKEPLLGNDLNALAARFELSPSHYQKVFKQHVGVSPKQFQQSLLVGFAIPKIVQGSLLNASEQLNLSSPSRLHDAFVQIEAMSPGEFKSQGNRLVFHHGIQTSLFGDLSVICTKRGIHYMGLSSDPITDLKVIQARYPHAQFVQCKKDEILGYDPFQSTQPINLHVSATNFQVNVWRALLNTSSGQIVSYKDIAIKIGNPNGSRGVGQAVGANPVAFLIPCHRVIKQCGGISGYRWGVDNKEALLAWEQALEIQLELPD